MIIRSKPLALLATGAVFLLLDPALAAAEDEATIVVTATRMPTRASELINDITVLHRDDIEASSAATLPELLAAQPGVQITGNGGVGKTTSLFLRGANSQHTVVLIDGMRINSATLGDTAIQHIPLSQIERIEIVRGPVSSLYGSEAIGGVVQIFTRRGDDAPGTEIQASYGSRNTSDVSASIAGAGESTNYALTVGRYETDGISAIANPASASYNPDADGYRQESVSGRVGLQLAPGHELAANLFHSDGVTRYDPNTAPYDARICQTLQGIGIESKNKLAKHWASTLRVIESMDDSTTHSSATSKGIIKTGQTQIVWQNDFRTPIGDFLAGAERLEQHLTSTTAYARKDRTVDSLLLGYQGRFDQHRLQASTRRDDNSQFGARTTGMAYYGYQITPSLRASVGAGTSFSAPTFNQLYYPSGWGNPNLKPEQGRNKEASAVWENGHARASLTWFDNKIDNLIDYRLSLTPKYRNIAKARLTGWTVAAETSRDGWHPRLAYDWLDARDESTGLMLPRRARQHMTLGLAKDIGTWTASGEIVASSSRNDTASTTTRRLGGYAMVNAGIDYRHSADITLFARAANIFGKRYELAADYGTLGASLYAGIRYAPR